MSDRVLTQASVGRLEARDGQERSEYPVKMLTGLWLRCSRSGHKAWYLRTRIDGAERRKRIGSAEAFSLAVEAMKVERWLGESGQRVEWSFCLNAARLAAGQERR